MGILSDIARPQPRPYGGSGELRAGQRDRNYAEHADPQDLAGFGSALKDRFLNAGSLFTTVRSNLSISAIGEICAVGGYALSRAGGFGSLARFVLPILGDELGSAFYTAGNRECGWSWKNVGLDLSQGLIARTAIQVGIGLLAKMPLPPLAKLTVMAIGTPLALTAGNLLSRWIVEGDNPFERSPYGIALEVCDAAFLAGINKGKSKIAYKGFSLDLERMGRERIDLYAAEKTYVRGHTVEFAPSPYLSRYRLPDPIGHAIGDLMRQRRVPLHAAQTAFVRFSLRHPDLPPSQLTSAFRAEHDIRTEYPRELVSGYLTALISLRKSGALTDEAFNARLDRVANGLDIREDIQRLQQDPRLARVTVEPLECLSKDQADSLRAFAEGALNGLDAMSLRDVAPEIPLVIRVENGRFEVDEPGIGMNRNQLLLNFLVRRRSTTRESDKGSGWFGMGSEQYASLLHHDGSTVGLRTRNGDNPGFDVRTAKRADGEYLSIESCTRSQGTTLVITDPDIIPVRAMQKLFACFAHTNERPVLVNGMAMNAQRPTTIYQASGYPVRIEEYGGGTPGLAVYIGHTSDTQLFFPGGDRHRVLRFHAPKHTPLTVVARDAVTAGPETRSQFTHLFARLGEINAIQTRLDIAGQIAPFARRLSEVPGGFCADLFKTLRDHCAAWIGSDPVLPEDSMWDTVQIKGRTPYRLADALLPDRWSKDVESLRTSGAWDNVVLAEWNGESALALGKRPIGSYDAQTMVVSRSAAARNPDLLELATQLAGIGSVRRRRPPRRTDLDEAGSPFQGLFGSICDTIRLLGLQDCTPAFPEFRSKANQNQAFSALLASRNPHRILFLSPFATHIVETPSGSIHFEPLDAQPLGGGDPHYFNHVSPEQHDLAMLNGSWCSVIGVKVEKSYDSPGNYWIHRVTATDGAIDLNGADGTRDRYPFMVWRPEACRLALPLIDAEGPTYFAPQEKFFERCQRISFFHSFDSNPVLQKLILNIRSLMQWTRVNPLSDELFLARLELYYQGHPSVFADHLLGYQAALETCLSDRQRQIETYYATAENYQTEKTEYDFGAIFSNHDYAYNRAVSERLARFLRDRVHPESHLKKELLPLYHLLTLPERPVADMPRPTLAPSRRAHHLSGRIAQVRPTDFAQTELLASRGQFDIERGLILAAVHTHGLAGAWQRDLLDLAIHSSGNHTPRLSATFYTDHTQRPTLRYTLTGNLLLTLIDLLSSVRVGGRIPSTFWTIFQPSYGREVSEVRLLVPNETRASGHALRLVPIKNKTGQVMDIAVHEDALDVCERDLIVEQVLAAGASNTLAVIGSQARSDLVALSRFIPNSRIAIHFNAVPLAAESKTIGTWRIPQEVSREFAGLEVSLLESPDPKLCRDHVELHDLPRELLDALPAATRTRHNDRFAVLAISSPSHALTRRIDGRGVRDEAELLSAMARTLSHRMTLNEFHLCLTGEARFPDFPSEFFCDGYTLDIAESTLRDAAILNSRKFIGDFTPYAAGGTRFSHLLFSIRPAPGEPALAELRSRILDPGNPIHPKNYDSADLFLNAVFRVAPSYADNAQIKVALRRGYTLDKIEEQNRSRGIRLARFQNPSDWRASPLHQAFHDLTRDIAEHTWRALGNAGIAVEIGYIRNPEHSLANHGIRDERNSGDVDMASGGKRQNGHETSYIHWNANDRLDEDLEILAQCLRRSDYPETEWGGSIRMWIGRVTHEITHQNGFPFHDREFNAKQFEILGRLLGRLPPNYTRSLWDRLRSRFPNPTCTRDWLNGK